MKHHVLFRGAGGKYFSGQIVFLLAFFVLSAASTASAAKYGNYDLERLVRVSETPSGKAYSIDTAYLDQVIRDLSVHAGSYPTQFDTPQDKQRATQDAKALSGMLDILINVPSPNPELLFRAGYVNIIGYNLDIAGAAEKADAIFRKLLTASPSDPRGNYRYGAFLAGSGKPKEALPYLKKALAAGVDGAAYSLGMTYLSLGDKEQALKNLEDYKRRKPGDTSVDTLIDAIRNGKVTINRSPA
jgi:tetratricopeptide (TPR) repeat protein